jgi:hypothetical protein
LFVTLWHFDVQILKERFSQSMIEIRLSFEATSEDSKNWDNVIKLGSVSHWMDIFNIHQALIDLLSRADIWFLRCTSWNNKRLFIT